MYNPQSIADRINQLSKKKKIQQKVMLEQCGMNKNVISTMLSRGSVPKADNLAKIADYLDCSVDYLLGRTDTPEINQHTDINRLPHVEINSSSASFASGYVEHELLLIEKYRHLSSSGQQKLHDRADELQLLGFTQEEESKNVTPQKMA